MSNTPEHANIARMRREPERLRRERLLVGEHIQKLSLENYHIHIDNFGCARMVIDEVRGECGDAGRAAGLTDGRCRTCESAFKPQWAA